MDEEYVNHKTYYGSGYDEYNFPIETMNDSNDMLILIDQARECEQGITNGAVLLITEKQYILAFNRGRGRGAHDSAIARIFSDITDQVELGYKTVGDYRRKAESILLHAKIFCEKQDKTSKVSNIISFSFNRGKEEDKRKITQKEFNSFMAFYDEYAWIFRRGGFKVSLMGKSLPSIDNVKEVLESMIDNSCSLPEEFTNTEKIIGCETNKADEMKI